MVAAIIILKQFIVKYLLLIVLWINNQSVASIIKIIAGNIKVSPKRFVIMVKIPALNERALL